MRLIDADKLLTSRRKQMYYHLPNGDTAIPIIDIEHAPTVQGWVSVKDRLPKTSQQVLVFNDPYGDGYMDVVYYSAKFKAFNATDETDEYKLKNVTHWMPLPKPPEE